MGIFNSFAGFASVLGVFFGSVPPNSEVCFGPDIKCFSNDLSCHSLDMSAPEDINTRFFLYTRFNRARAQEITWKNLLTIEASHFSGERPTKFIIHGWIENTGKSAFIKMKNTILDAEDANVIMVDWRGGSLDIYETSVQNIRVVGREMAILARKLARKPFGASLANMHAIGHSLGSHVAGYAGSELAGFGRITALDPAGPYFRGPRLHNDCRLDKTDALFVDVIHTDGTNTSSLIMGINGLGLQEQLGHQDFYPNGGRHMTGCLPLTHCSHYRAVYYLTESIMECPYTASHRCESWELIDKLAKHANCTAYAAASVPKRDRPRMGYWASAADGQGAYFLRTAGSPPYC